MRLKILQKLRSASLNSEFTGSYKKKCSGGGSQNKVDLYGKKLELHKRNFTSIWKQKDILVCLCIAQFEPNSPWLSKNLRIL